MQFAHVGFSLLHLIWLGISHGKPLYRLPSGIAAPFSSGRTSTPRRPSASADPRRWWGRAAVIVSAFGYVQRARPVSIAVNSVPWIGGRVEREAQRVRSADGRAIGPLVSRGKAWPTYPSGTSLHSQCGDFSSCSSCPLFLGTEQPFLASQLPLTQSHFFRQFFLVGRLRNVDGNAGEAPARVSPVSGGPRLALVFHHCLLVWTFLRLFDQSPCHRHRSWLFISGLELEGTRQRNPAVVIGRDGVLTECGPEARGVGQAGDRLSCEESKGEAYDLTGTVTHIGRSCWRG